MLVDDEKERRDAVRQLLLTNGYPAVTADDSEHALALLADEKYDLILLDITLPDRNGYNVIEFLRKNRLASRVIVMTGTGTAGMENVILTATLRARDYITKPYNPEYLLKCVEHILSDGAQKNFKIQIIKAGDFIKSTPTGDLDMTMSRQGFAQIASAGIDLEEYTVLIDLRDVTSSLTPVDIFELGENLDAYGQTFRRNTAILVPAAKGLDEATFFEKVALNRGFDVKVFTEYEAAVNWLSSIAVA